MKVLSFLTMFLLTTALTSGYTVVLRNGKSIHGTLVGEDTLTVQIRDQHGTFLSVGRHLMDTRLTTLANEPFVRRDHPARKMLERPRNLVELAEMCKKNRTGNVPVFRDVSFHRTSDISVLGTTEESKVVLEIPADSGTIPSREEKHWRREARSIRTGVRRLRERQIAAEAACIRSQNKRDTHLHTPARKPMDLLSVMDETSECKRAREIDLQMSEEELRWTDFEERARKAGIPYAWLE